MILPIIEFYILLNHMNYKLFTIIIILSYKGNLLKYFFENLI